MVSCLNATGKIDFTGTCAIRIMPSASLKLHMAGGDAKLSGAGVFNGGGNARNFSYYELPGNTKLEFSQRIGHSRDLHRNKLRSQRRLKIAGETTVTGAIVANSIYLSGDSYIRYDEALGSGSSAGKCIIASWDEI